MAAGTLKVIQFQQPEKSRQEVALDRSIDDLVAIMRELDMVGKMTGRIGLPQRV